MIKSRSAKVVSSSVDLNASIRVCGRFEIKPTVSVSRIKEPSAKASFLVVGSSVAKSLSSTNTSAPVRAFSRLDFPALVYPTRAHEGVAVLSRCFLCTCLFMII